MLHDPPPLQIFSSGQGGAPGRGNGNGQGPPSSTSGQGSQRGAPPMGQFGVLHIIGGNDRGKQYQLDKLVTTVGRGADQELVLADIAVSRKHMKIYLQQNGYRIQDLGSGNGTLINGKRLEEVMLVDGDQVELGNTLLRFEHPPSRQAAEPASAYPPPQPFPPPQAFPPQQAYPPPQPFPPPQAFPMQQPMPPMQQQGPYGSAMAPSVPAQQQYASSVAQQQVMAPVAAVPPAPLSMSGAVAEPHSGGGFLATERSRKIAFPAVGALLLGGLGLLAFTTLKANRVDPNAEPNAAVARYNEGTTRFNAEDYNAARKAFQEARLLAPSSPELEQYLKACDVEEAASAAVKRGKAEVENHRYGEALAAFKQVDDKSVQYDAVQGQIREVRLQAISAALTEARSLSLSEQNRDKALAKIEEGLKYDPQNPDLLSLKEKIEAGSAAPRLPKTEPVKVARVEPKVHVPHRDRVPAAGPARPAVPDGPVASGADLQSSKGAMIAYRSRDFGGAASTMQNFAKMNKGATQAKAQATAREIDEVRGLADKGAKLESSNPQQAVAAYNSALAADRRVSGGVLAAYFGDKVKQLAARGGGKPVPGTTPKQGPVVATPVQGRAAGAGDPVKDPQADRFLQQARAVMGKDPDKARTFCRQAMRLYQVDNKVNSPKYLEAFKLLNSIKGRDEDE